MGDYCVVLRLFGTWRQPFGGKYVRWEGNGGS